MKKIPGTLYHLGITSARDEKLNINIWYKNQLVFEKTGILTEEIINTIQLFFESKNLPIPSSVLSVIALSRLLKLYL